MVVTLSVLALVISILGILISSGVAIYVYRKTYKQAEVHHEDSLHKTAAQHEDSLRESRIGGVVSEYQRLLHSKKSSDLRGLIQAGMAKLANEEEAQEAIKRIANLQGQRNPLSTKQNDIETVVGVLRFFQNITDDECKTPGKLDEIISALRK